MALIIVDRNYFISNDITPRRNDVVSVCHTLCNRIVGPQDTILKNAIAKNAAQVNGARGKG